MGVSQKPDCSFVEDIAIAQMEGERKKPKQKRLANIRIGNRIIYLGWEYGLKIGFLTPVKVNDKTRLFGWIASVHYNDDLRAWILAGKTPAKWFGRLAHNDGDVDMRLLAVGLIGFQLQRRSVSPSGGPAAKPPGPSNPFHEMVTGGVKRVW